MNPDYIFPIPKVYVKSQEDIREIQRYQHKAPTDRWDSYVGFKKNIKNHLLTEQKGRCMFCRRVIDESQASAEIEHLVPKSKYPQFETLPENLVVTCHNCNNKKGTKNPLANSHPAPTQQTYPNQGGDFLTIYPYIDKYEQHIDIDETGFAVRLSQKGEVTISWYGLNREQLIIKRNEDIHKHSFPPCRQLLLELCESYGRKQQQIESQLREIINRFKIN